MEDAVDGSVAAWDRGQARFHSYDDRLHAVIRWIDESRDDAEQADERRRSGVSRGELDGALVAVKDNIDVAGVPTTCGARFLGSNVPTSDATVIRLMKERGLTVVAKLNMAELAKGATTQNETYGSCRNPWDVDRIPGGSSGGSGVAVAAGYVDLALGTDTGASVRLPAAVNGVVGLRPSTGVISNSGVYPVARSLDTVGPMGRSALDVARLTEILVAFDSTDPYSVRHDGPPVTSLIGKPLRGMTVGIVRDYFFDDLEAPISTAIENFVEWLASEGVNIAVLPDFGAASARDHWLRISQCENLAVHRARLLSRPEDFSFDIRSRLSAGLEVLGSELAESLHFRAEYHRKLARLFDGVDFVVSPVTSFDVPRIEGYDSREQTTKLGRLTYPWALHDGPTLGLPVGFHPDSDTPIGVALSGARFNEATLFQVAAQYQRSTDWHSYRPDDALDRVMQHQQ
jgi:aspartyl-tRNA(Asn)/glutamyl-tRNA(Gln) amidotransferase subunit A